MTTKAPLAPQPASWPAPQFHVGVDTHADTHTIAILDAAGRVAETSTHSATPEGYREVIGTLRGLGDPSVVQVGVEGTNSYGAGLTRALADDTFEVFEVLRPTRQVRRMDGKSDPIDAVEAARTLMSGRGISVPKSGIGTAESLRYLTVARNKYVSTMIALSNAILALLVTAPAQIRTKYGAKGTKQTLRNLQHCRPGHLDTTSVDFYVLTTLKTMAKTHQTLQEAADQLEKRMGHLVEAHYPALLNLHGVGVITAATLAVTAGDNPQRIHSEAAFAKMCGACPIPASSGRTNRHRLNRGGDRQANMALHRIALVRMRHHEPTRKYVARQVTRGKTKREAIRQVKRALCRTVYRTLTQPQPTPQPDQNPELPDGPHLRLIRTQKGLTQAQVATALDTNPTQISNIETDRWPHTKLRARYHQWLKTPTKTQPPQTRPPSHQKPETNI